ncbi:MAG: HlyD family efflux transporter periplasmic adaptor subunit, partial [Pseudomonadota bacterium]
MPTQLFRREVIDYQNRRRLGDVLLSTPTPTWVFTALASAFLIALVGFLSAGTYTRKVNARGWISPKSGEVRIQSPTEGIVTQLVVAIGDDVRAGDPLAVITPSLADQGGAKGVDDRIARLRDERAEIENRITLAKTEAKTEEANTLRRLRHLKTLTAELGRQIDISAQRLKLSEEFERSVAQLEKEGAASIEEVRERTDTVLRNSIEFSRLQQEREIAEEDIAAETERLVRSSRNAEITVSELRQRQSELQRLEGELSARRRLTLRAPVSGAIGELRLIAGQSVQEGQPALAILPEGDVLEAEVFLPTRAVGTVAIGQDVRVRLDAFPSKLFTTLPGRVREVSATTTSPTVLPTAFE